MNEETIYTETVKMYMKKISAIVQKDLPKDLVALLIGELPKDLDLIALNKAGDTLVKTWSSDYGKFPVVCDWLKAGGIIETDDKLKLQAEDEFQQVLRGISRAGYMNPIFFENGITGACVRDIGWNKLCQMTNDEMTWIKKDFIAGYLSCYKSGRLHQEVINKCNGDLKVIKSNINKVEMIEYKPEERSNQTLRAIEYRG